MVKVVDAPPKSVSFKQNANVTADTDKEVVISIDSEAVAITVAAISFGHKRPQLTMQLRNVQ